MYTHQRKAIDLNGIWKFNPDPYRRCRQQAWWKNEAGNDSFFPCWDMEGLWEIQVPGTWKTQFEELKWYDGDANYVRDFELEEVREDEEYFLVFDGVVYACEVYLNGEHAGSHDWGYSPFQLRVTDLIRRQNRLFVLVENKLSEDRAPGIRFDWNNDGGIINGVKLVAVPRVYIENFRTETRLEGDQAVVGVECWVAGAGTGSLPVTFEIPELGVLRNIDVPVNGSAGTEIRLPCTADGGHATPEELLLWSPDHPRLYTTRLTTQHEVIEDQIGYREIRTQGRDVILNGEPIRLYGVCTHAEFPGTGRTATGEGIDQLVHRIKELGCNFVRCAHYPYADLWARAMDRAGLLWWEEVPVYWLANIHHDHMTRLALGMLEETIRRDWNRAGLIIWSVSNECAGTDSDGTGLGFGNYPYWEKACALVRRLDPSRLISSADSGHRKTVASKWTPEAGDAFDEQKAAEKWLPGHPDAFYALLDVLSGNVYCSKPGDGLSAYHKFADMLRGYNKPLMISEFGSMSLMDGSFGEETLGSEAYHGRILREAYQSFRELPEISGYMPWCLMDVRVPMHWRWYNAGKGVFRYGLLDERFHKKKVFDVVAEETARLKETFSPTAPAPESGVVQTK